jgi:L-asparaginase
MVVLNDRIGSAMYTTKMNTRAMDTFKAVEQGYLGVFLDASPIFYYPPSRYTNRFFFDVSTASSLPKVTILYGYQEMDVALLDAAVRTGAKGIVIAGVGDASLPKTWESAVKQYTSNGVPVVLASRTGQTFVSPNKDRSFITSGNYNPQKARILLQLVLLRYGRVNATMAQRFFNPY